MTHNIQTLIASLSLTAAAAVVALAPSEAHAAGWYNCQPTALFETNDQLQVSCANGHAPNPTVTWTAVNRGDLTTEELARFWSAASSAILSGRVFRVYITDDQCGWGAQCRLATSWSLYFHI